ncbi:MAG: hypothetical protein Q8K33_14430 [Cypionkella sp.]|uniref:hypothetical protein n=1 Tax=Cypionkella sp. TaxID=2811411 RepID=UPI00273016FF|nr:hypothetical protein [Cypionkella sp.]MDP2050056.1 hypothetical protein [Cypionkella sp.]
MTDQEAAALESAIPPTEMDVGKPVEWMIDPNQRQRILGVTYEFSQTGERKTVWYTPSKRRAKPFVIVTDLQTSLC